MALVRVQIDGKICRRKTARAQFDIEQVALNGRAHRKLGRRAHRDLAQAVAEHDLAQLGQGRQALGQQVEQALVVALLKRQAALEKVEIQGRRVHNAKLCHLVARRHARTLVFEGASRSAQAKEICRPVVVGNRNFAGHEPIVDANRHGKARLGRHGVEHSGSGEVSVFAQHGQCHAAEFAHLLGGDMDRRATGQQTRQKRCGMLGKRRIGAARAVRVDQIGNVARGKAVHIGGQAQVVAATGRRRDLGGKEQRLFCRGLVLPHRRRLNRYLIGTMRCRSPRPGGLKGNGPAR